MIKFSKEIFLIQKLKLNQNIGANKHNRYALRQTGGKEAANIDSKRHPTQDNNPISMKKKIETRLQTNTTNCNAKKKLS